MKRGRMEGRGKSFFFSFLFSRLNIYMFLKMPELLIATEGSSFYFQILFLFLFQREK